METPIGEDGVAAPAPFRPENRGSLNNYAPATPRCQRATIADQGRRSGSTAIADGMRDSLLGSHIWRPCEEVLSIAAVATIDENGGRLASAWSDEVERSAAYPGGFGGPTLGDLTNRIEPIIARISVTDGVDFVLQTTGNIELPLPS